MRCFAVTATIATFFLATTTMPGSADSKVKSQFNSGSTSTSASSGAARAVQSPGPQSWGSQNWGSQNWGSQNWGTKSKASR